MTTKSEPQAVNTKIDWYLQTLVAAVTRTGSPLNISLTVGGSLVTGKLISGKEYFTRSADQFASALKSSGAREEDVSAARASIVDPAGSIYDASADPVESYGYIHLKDVSIHSNGKVYRLGDVPWRGKLSSVDSFFMDEVSGS